MPPTLTGGAATRLHREKAGDFLKLQQPRLDETQFVERTNACRERLYRMAYCYVKNESDALEIVSQAVYKGYLSYKKLKSPAYFETWMCRIVINCALDLQKKQRRAAPLDDAVLCPAPSAGLASEEKMDLYDALDTLTDSEKTYIVLKFFEERSFKEIAQMLGVPESTAKTSTSRILDKLHRILHQEET